MIMINFDLYMAYQQRQEELLKEVEHDRLVKEALKARQPQDHNASTVLARIGRKLANLGSSLEERYGAQPQAEVKLNSQSESGGC